jgi:hypothetical protein
VKRGKEHDHASFQHDVQGFAMILIFVAFFRLEVYFFLPVELPPEGAGGSLQ